MNLESKINIHLVDIKHIRSRFLKIKGPLSWRKKNKDNLNPAEEKTLKYIIDFIRRLSEHYFDLIIKQSKMNDKQVVYRVVGSTFNEPDQVGDFNWMIQQTRPDWERILYIFNDNVYQFASKSCKPGGGNAAIRKYNKYSKIDKYRKFPRAAGIPTGDWGEPLEGGFPSLDYLYRNKTAKEWIDESISVIKELLGTGNYSHVVWSEGKDDKIGSSIFAKTLGKDVIDYVTDQIKKLGDFKKSGPQNPGPIEQFVKKRGWTNEHYIADANYYDNPNPKFTDIPPEYPGVIIEQFSEFNVIPSFHIKTTALSAYGAMGVFDDTNEDLGAESILAKNSNNDIHRGPTSWKQMHKLVREWLLASLGELPDKQFKIWGMLIKK